ncbi:MAG TPA: anthranilate synthase component I family protein, partial [Phaeodactylibacter sp.]|nr:anthranilate synthase component I family protein [Phaeodactylibacter sp.]
MRELLFEKNTITFSIEDSAIFKKKAFAWASDYDVVCYLDSNEHQSKYSTYEGLLGVGAAQQIMPAEQKGDSFSQIKKLYEAKKDWLFGFLTYDLKNEIEDLSSDNYDGIHLPGFHFFQPKIVIEFLTSTCSMGRKEVRIHSKAENPVVLFEKINATPMLNKGVFSNKKIQKGDIQMRISKADYLETISKIKTHIQKGDIYEMNFCQEFYVENAEVNPYALFEKFNAVGKAPFAAFYKFKNKYLLCESPERFLKKEKQQLITQPIKGTIKRGATPQEDQRLKEQLFHSPKDRSENVMIVDLVRNDLAKSCKAGTVEVEELFGIYSFEQVHQMISTVVGELKEEVHFVDALKNAYPMGSMTGAPKIRAMQLIEQLEKTKRGLYSGAVGYITPAGDFDFNVVIRSMIYNQEEKYLSYQTGGAIVADSSPEGEYEECLLKAKGFF